MLSVYGVNSREYFALLGNGNRCCETKTRVWGASDKQLEKLNIRFIFYLVQLYFGFMKLNLTHSTGIFKHVLYVLAVLILLQPNLLNNFLYPDFLMKTYYNSFLVSGFFKIE